MGIGKLHGELDRSVEVNLVKVSKNLFMLIVVDTVLYLVKDNLVELFLLLSYFPGLEDTLRKELFRIVPASKVLERLPEFLSLLLMVDQKLLSDHLLIKLGLLGVR